MSFDPQHIVDRNDPLRHHGLRRVFVEDVILGGLKAGPSWFVSDNLLRRDASSGVPDDVAREIADRNDLRYERVVAGGVEGVRFWRIE
ncbi:MAG: hypothetical protein ACJ71Q_11175 [Terriglobales bacterium]